MLGVKEMYSLSLHVYTLDESDCILSLAQLFRLLLVKLVSLVIFISLY